MKEKIISTIQIIKDAIRPKAILIDEKISAAIPNPKIKKIVYIGGGSLFGLMFLIILLGILLSPFRKQTSDNSSVLNKPNITSTSPEQQKELSETQKKLLNLETRTKEMTTPNSDLNIPVLEFDIKI